MRDRLNCPNCGAPIDGVKCSYCGTMFYDFASIKAGETSYLRIRASGDVIVCKAVCESVWTLVPSGGEAFPEFDIHFCAVPDDRGVILERRQDAED